MSLVWTALAVTVLIVATFAVAIRRARFDTIDSVWGLGFAVIAVVSCVMSAGSPGWRVLVTGLTVVWGLRLSVHIATRNHGAREDRRYARMRRHPGRIFVRVYLAQGVLMWVISLPVQVAQLATPSLGLVIVGIAVWLLGFVFEAIGDLQLLRFRRTSGSGVLDTGLWRYTRHPNYFGDACVWWGLYLLACHSWLAALTIVAPLVITALLAKGSGKPVLEQDLLQRRPAYADYILRTSGFFPLPSRRK
ncbi:DUF1295 domain-containing protein [Amycolatopsis alkalitolerans]|uniref:DUF1295 domain-containing protein n=1 Tax=Amycolatopsis alkalitolerans TaxID=2547244 RepID=A0A5C4LQY7_9PSEU|nr:DUF1295 domain-containing protein [Amycolatopsis alkalitolerans]TNC20583.1 DUF1295 domain-containing protein [Amycolatopsis alkalitolerans]